MVHRSGSQLTPARPEDYVTLCTTSYAHKIQNLTFHKPKRRSQPDVDSTTGSVYRHRDRIRARGFLLLHVERYSVKGGLIHNNDVMAEAPGTQTSSTEIKPPEAQLESKIFQKVISSGLTVKPQQRGVPDLTEPEKASALSSLLHDRPGAFLMRYGKVLESDHLEYFSNSSDYEVTFRVKELQKHLVPANRIRRTRNRRFEYMKELMDTDYFTVDEMRQRNPLLFRHYVGQYMSEDELAVLDGSTTTDMTLSSHILRRMRQDERRERERKQVCVCVCLLERERRVGREWERESVCLREKGGERGEEESMCVRQKSMKREEREKVCVCVLDRE